MINSDDEHWSIVGWGRDDHLLGSTLQVGLGGIGGSKDTSGLNNGFDACLSPGYLFRLRLIENCNILPVNN